MEWGSAHVWGVGLATECRIPRLISRGCPTWASVSSALAANKLRSMSAPLLGVWVKHWTALPASGDENGGRTSRCVRIAPGAARSLACQMTARRECQSARRDCVYALGSTHAHRVRSPSASASASDRRGSSIDMVEHNSRGEDVCEVHRPSFGSEARRRSGEESSALKFLACVPKCS
jgi:hypothetical protein